MTPTPGFAWGTLSATKVDPEATAIPKSLGFVEAANIEKVPAF
jgi:hypothetical protein